MSLEGGGGQAFIKNLCVARLLHTETTYQEMSELLCSSEFTKAKRLQSFTLAVFLSISPLRKSKAFTRSCLLMLRHGPENGKAILAVPKVVYPLLRSMNFTVHSLNVQWNSVFLIYSFPLLRLLFWLCWRYLGRGSRLCLRGAGGGRRSWFGLRLRGLL